MIPHIENIRSDEKSKIYSDNGMDVIGFRATNILEKKPL